MVIAPTFQWNSISKIQLSYLRFLTYNQITWYLSGKIIRYVTRNIDPESYKWQSKVLPRSWDLTSFLTSQFPWLHIEIGCVIYMVVLDMREAEWMGPEQTETHIDTATVLSIDFLSLCVAKILSCCMIYISFILKCQNAIPTMVHFIIFYFIELSFNSNQ